jgi:hypothetical protein
MHALACRVTSQDKDFVPRQETLVKFARELMRKTIYSKTRPVATLRHLVQVLGPSERGVTIHV